MDILSSLSCLSRESGHMRSRRVLFARYAVVVLQDAQARPNQIVKLATVGRAEEDPDRDKDDDNAERDEQIECFHDQAVSSRCSAAAPLHIGAAALTPSRARAMRRRRKAFNTTTAELTDMPMPDSQGL